tara:strand:- start:61 stop:624 length:564 start_codon:yes stop_codon:yes gene_type:complete
MFFCPNCSTKYDISNKNNSTLQKGGINISDFLKKLIDDKISVEYLDKNNIDIDNVIRTKEYNKFSKSNKSKIISKLNKLMNSNNSKKKNKYHAILICLNCGTKEDIKEGTCLYSKDNDNEINKQNIKDFKFMKDSHILPRTTNYICNNEKCETHKKPSLKEAMFFRDQNNYNIIYLCLHCNSNWYHS